ncbi:hypothetical protein WN51_03551 [Melipona quadrifasciata]|uniref:Uncharacterized protein n=1 Tax=Melipona quadrifasciata TaxID=166423 RepID=A0A0M8ZTT6_9HYME|nr:hypothetical protein WN51_03551 [Melipona quadrifasciata]
MQGGSDSFSETIGKLGDDKGPFATEALRPEIISLSEVEFCQICQFPKKKDGKKLLAHSVHVDTCNLSHANGDCTGISGAQHRNFVEYIKLAK